MIDFDKLQLKMNNLEAVIKRVGEAADVVIQENRDLRAEVERLTRELVDYDLLKRAVNESTNECGPDCDSHGHGDSCPANDGARWLIDQQKEIDRLRGLLRDGIVYVVNCALDPEQPKEFKDKAFAWSRSAQASLAGTADQPEAAP